MLRMRDQQAIRKPVHYLYTVANNLVKEHAVLDRRNSPKPTVADGGTGSTGVGAGYA
jgi:hypothetical protein